MATRLHRELNRSPIARKSVGCLSVLFLMIALLTGYASWLRLSSARETSGWTPVKGTIEKAGIEETWSNGQTLFAPRLTYRFQVGDKTQRGDQISPHDQEFGSRALAEEAIAAYSVGGEVILYYNPEDPAKAVLQPGAVRMDYLMMGLPLLFLFFAYGFFQMLQRAWAAGKADEPEDSEPGT